MLPYFTLYFTSYDNGAASYRQSPKTCIVPLVSALQEPWS